MASLGLSAAEREAIDAFKNDVVEPSMTKLVILDFWAEWCGPCKALTPVLEKVAADYADRGVLLKKINVDENKLIAAQFRVQSIPTVYALFQGQLVADLTPARTEKQFAQYLDQLLKQLPIQGEAQQLEAELEPLIAMGEQVLAEGDPERAIGIFTQLHEMAPEEPAVVSGLARALVSAGQIDDAAGVIETLAEETRKDPAIARAESAIALAREAQPVDDLTGVQRRVDADPDDYEARYELAGGLMAAGDRDGAADQLLAIIAADRGWNQGAARDRLLKLLEVVGLEDPWTSATRRRLSAVLFT
jgi:putative thioredoxin